MVPARSQIGWQISSGSEWGRSGVGTVRIRHYRVRKGRGYWEPTYRMKAAGFRLTALGPEGPDAWGKAERLNVAWDKARRNDTRAATFESDTLGWLFEQYRHTGVWAAKEPRTREEWELAWRTIGPVFSDVLVAKTISKLATRFIQNCARRPRSITAIASSRFSERFWRSPSPSSSSARIRHIGLRTPLPRDAARFGSNMR